MTIALDAMGGDRAPAELVKGALIANLELDIDVTLVGDERLVREELAGHGRVPSSIELVSAGEAIAMHESPVQAVRQKKDASINIAMGLLKRGEAAGVVSAGSTGAVMASALLNLGRVRGIERPAIGTLAPYTDTGILVLDVGANADCKPSYLVQFASMGAVYVEKVFGIARPRVWLLNIGEEDGKGNELTLEVYERLRQSDLNFVGNIEPNRVHHAVADVIVTDGFTGNIAVKVTEGTAEFIFNQLRAAIMSRRHYKLAAAILRPALRAMAKRMDYAEYGGAPLIGVDGVVIVAHGHADAHAVRNALRSAQETAQSGMLEALREAFGKREAVAPATAPS